jgi:methylglutaconyl-CoA hydratase
MAYEVIKLDLDECGVPLVTLNRPERHNALNRKMVAELHAVAFKLADDDRVRVVVLTGSGRSLCASGDIGWFRDTLAMNREGRMEGSCALTEMLNALYRLPKPVIGRISRAAYGSVTGMVSVCDIAVADSAARFGLTEVRLSLILANVSPYIVAHVSADLETSLTAVTATKKLIAFVDAHDIEAAKDHTSEALVDAWETDDGREGIASFLAKRLPNWRLGG